MKTDVDRVPVQAKTTGTSRLLIVVLIGFVGVIGYFIGLTSEIGPGLKYSMTSAGEYVYVLDTNTDIMRVFREGKEVNRVLMSVRDDDSELIFFDDDEDANEDEQDEDEGEGSAAE